MSLVGPRPSLPKEVLKFEPWMLDRLNVKPGLTCYWQVSGRNNIDFVEWMKLDLKYVNEILVWVFFSEDKKMDVIKANIRSRGPVINAKSIVFFAALRWQSPKSALNS